MTQKTRRQNYAVKIDARIDERGRRKLSKLATLAGKPGNLSAGLRLLLAQTPETMTGMTELFEQQNTGQP